MKKISEACKTELKTKLKNLLFDDAGYRKFYVSIIETKTKQKVQVFVAKDDEVINVTRAVGIVTARKFSRNFKFLMISDISMMFQDMFSELVENPHQQFSQFNWICL